MELMTGFEPVASSLPRKCSTPELHEPMERAMGIEPTSPAWKAGVIATIRRSLKSNTFNHYITFFAPYPTSIITNSLHPLN